MITQSFIDSLTRQLGALGFILTEERTGGPMGSALWRFSSEFVDLEFQSDRGTPVIVCGPRGRALFNFLPWADLLGTNVDKSADYSEQFEFFVNNIGLISQEVRNDPDIQDKLEDLNWAIIKHRLHLDPRTPRPGRSGSGPGSAGRESAP
jgi:hypothetical protein